MSDYLKRRWAKTLETAGLVEKPERVSLIDDIIASYSEPHRKYHTCRHLEQCFKLLDEMFVEVPQRAAVELALWYHDLIYKPLGENNEAMSGYVAQNIATVRLGASGELARAIHVLILLTTHKPVEHPTNEFVLKTLLDNESLLKASRVVLDVDLSILSVSDLEFDAYEDEVRAEYAMVPDEIFGPARASIMARFLMRPALYTTPQMKTREPQARANLERSIAKLGFTFEEARDFGAP